MKKNKSNEKEKSFSGLVVLAETASLQLWGSLQKWVADNFYLRNFLRVCV